MGCNIELFTVFEDNYKNKKVDGIDITVGKASTEGIVLNSNATLNNCVSIEINIYKNKYYPISRSKGALSSANNILLTPDKQNYLIVKGDDDLEEYDEDIPENQFIIGETYRIDIGLFDKDYNLVYRQREYATIK